MGMKTLFVLIAVAGLTSGCATYERGAPGYPEDVETGTMGTTNPRPAWPGVEVGTPSGSMREERPLP